MKNRALVPGPIRLLSSFALLAAMNLVARTAFAGPLETAAEEQGARQAVGAQPVGLPLVGSGEKTDFNIMLQGNTCYWFSGVAEAKVKRLSLYLWAPGAGTFTPRITDARPQENRAVMAHCTGPAGMYKMQAKIEGKGAYSVVLFAKAAPPPAPPGEGTVVHPEATTDLSPICEKTAQAAAPGATRVGEFASGKGGMWNNDVLESPVMLEGGNCYWIIGCGKPGDVKTLALRLLDGNNQPVVAPVANGPNPVVGYCAPFTGMYKYVARVNLGKGEYMVGLYAKRP